MPGLNVGGTFPSVWATSGRDALRYFKAPEVTRAEYPFWNRENWQTFSYGVTNAQRVPGAKVLGQNAVRTQVTSIAYVVPDGYNAYVTIVITTAVFGFFPSGGLTVDLAVAGPDATAQPTQPQHYIWYQLAFNSEEVRTVTLPLDEGQSIRIRGNCSYTVVGYEMPVGV